MEFTALDFETADPNRDSACAVALVRVSGREILACEKRLIRPPRPWVEFTWVHGLTWADVEHAPPFGEVWRELGPLLEGAEFLAAHNASFDRSVLRACCEASGVRSPALPFLCTMKLARRVWGISPTKLPDVCGALGLDLDHHDPESDALACAGIVLRAVGERGEQAIRRLL